MSDINVLKFVSLIPISTVGLVDQFTLKITGSDVRTTARVVINGVDSSEFSILSSRELVASIPSSERGNPIRSLTLVGEGGKASSIQFNLKSHTKMTDSIYVLQRFMRILLMRPGSDLFNPTIGVGLSELVGKVNFDDIESMISSSIRVAETQLKDLQNESLVDSKLLSVVELTDVSYSINNLTVSLSVKLTMQDGSNVSTDFTLAGS